MDAELHWEQRESNDFLATLQAHLTSEMQIILKIRPQDAMQEIHMLVILTRLYPDASVARRNAETTWYGASPHTQQ